MSIQHLPNLTWRNAVRFTIAAFFTAMLGVFPADAGQNLYVSKLGDNSDGSSWSRAFRTVQAARNAVPDTRGGHRIIVRPDTYMEANLFATQRGAAGI